MNVRSPAVAGSFYPFTKEQVESQLKDLFAYWDIDVASLDKRKRIDCKGVVVPHAGWEYSGYVAARVFADIPKVDSVILMGPNHYGLGTNISISSDDEWETPLGKVKIDKELGEAIAADSVAEFGELAHVREHSIEVQIPLLQKSLKKFKILPISIKHYAPDMEFLAVCQELGNAIAEAIVERKEKILIVSSTDFTHYEPAEVAHTKDKAAMQKIQNLDEAGLFETINVNRISMCGYAGVAANMAASKALGAKKGEKVEYMTSGDTTGDNSQVVGYGGLRIL